MPRPAPYMAPDAQCTFIFDCAVDRSPREHGITCCCSRVPRVPRVQVKHAQEVSGSLGRRHGGTWRRCGRSRVLPWELVFRGATEATQTSMPAASWPSDAGSGRTGVRRGRLATSHRAPCAGWVHVAVGSLLRGYRVRIAARGGSMSSMRLGGKGRCGWPGGRYGHSSHGERMGGRTEGAPCCES